jgi:hypothetical protein
MDIPTAGLKFESVHQPSKGTDMSRLSAALVAVIAVVLTGCGGGDQPLTLKQVAAKAGCSDVKAGELQIYTKEAATCTKGGHDLYIYTFADDGARDNWMKVAKAAGGPGSFAQGTSWIVQTM